MLLVEEMRVDESQNFVKAFCTRERECGRLRRGSVLRELGLRREQILFDLTEL